MGVAYYIALEDESKEINLSVDGKGIAKDQGILDKVAEDVGVIPLSQFFSVDNESVFDLLGEDDISIEIPEVSWFDAEDGLKTIQALLKCFKENNDGVSENTMTDLSDFEKILKEAADHNVRWHLVIDI